MNRLSRARRDLDKKIHLNPNQNFGCVIESNAVWDSAKCLKLASTDMSRTLLKELIGKRARRDSNPRQPDFFL